MHSVSTLLEMAITGCARPLLYLKAFVSRFDQTWRSSVRSAFAGASGSTVTRAAGFAAVFTSASTSSTSEFMSISTEIRPGNPEP
jgi:hypothetical protein